MPALAVTLHDPEGVSLPLIAASASLLGEYSGVAIAATAATSPLAIARLTELGAIVVPGGLAGESRRAALTAAGDGQTAYFVCDFDRWLHWAIYWPTELTALPERIAALRSHGTAPWYVCLGRTERAFRTHPTVQRLPETATNQAISLAARKPLDAVAGAAWLAPEARQIVLAGSIEPTAAADLEWPALILRRDPARLTGIRCQGLEWETPDFHAAAIANAGGEAPWVHAVYDTPAMWAARLELAAASAAALMRVIGGG